MILEKYMILKNILNSGTFQPVTQSSQLPLDTQITNEFAWESGWSFLLILGLARRKLNKFLQEEIQGQGGLRGAFDSERRFWQLDILDWARANGCPE